MYLGMVGWLDGRLRLANTNTYCKTCDCAAYAQAQLNASIGHQSESRENGCPDLGGYSASD